MRWAGWLSFFILGGSVVACASPDQTAALPSLSTQGTTLARHGTVTSFSVATASGATSNSRSAFHATIAVSLDDGSVRHYEFATDPGVRVGDSVIVSENRGKVTVLRQ